MNPLPPNLTSKFNDLCSRKKEMTFFYRSREIFLNFERIMADGCLLLISIVIVIRRSNKMKLVSLHLTLSLKGYSQLFFETEMSSVTSSINLSFV
jgi:hypothetical protein